jgi:transcription factor IIIB subunit 2
LIACKYHGFERSPSVLADIVRIGEVTIRKRLMELQQTPTAALTVDQFEAIKDDQPADDPDKGYSSLPPCLIRNRIKERKLFLKGITNDKVPVLPLADVCADSPTGEQLQAVADQVLESFGGSEGVAELLGSALVIRPEDEEEDDLGIHVNDLSDFTEDEDIAKYILTDEEAAAKSAIWHEWNRPYLEEWSMREEKRKRDAEIKAASAEPGKKRRGPAQSQIHESASQATQEVIEKKARLLVKKVSTDILDSLFRK